MKYKSEYKMILPSILLLLECSFLYSYFFNYDPFVGAKPLIYAFLLSIIGILTSTRIVNKKYRYSFIFIHILIFVIFPIILFGAIYYGF